MNHPTSNPLDDYLQQQSVLILDGGLASELERQGADLHHELWSAKVLLDNPELVRDAHLTYLTAGADIITSASYQASLEGLGKAGLNQSQALSLISRSVELAIEARSRFLESPTSEGRLRPLVAASIGPYGACLHDGSEYTGDYDLSLRQLIDFHRPRLEALIEAKPDLLAIETIPSLHEAESLTRLLEDYPDWPAWLCFSCKDGRRVSHGEPFSECLALAEDCPSIVAAGLNCTHPGCVPELLSQGEGINKPLMVYPNMGEPWDPGTGDWIAGAQLHLQPEHWVAAGARIVGGCCRVGPEEIAEMRRNILGAGAESGVEKAGPG